LGTEYFPTRSWLGYASTPASSLKQEYGIADDMDVYFELWSVVELDHVLEDIGLITPNLQELRKQGSVMFYDGAFEMPPDDENPPSTPGL